MKRFCVAVFAVVLCLLLMSCATTGWKGKAVSSYELAAVVLKTAYDVAKPGCEQGLLNPEDCVQLKTLYNQARMTYILAGEYLKIAIEAEDLAQKQAALQDYQELASAFTLSTTKMIELLTELGVIKSESPKPN